LDVSVHHGAAEPSGSLDGEADESNSEVEDAVGLRYGEPVTQPCAIVIQGVYPHGAHDIALDDRDEMQGLGVIVATITVGAFEEALLAGEDLVADAGCGRDLIGARSGSEQRIARGAVSQGRTVSVRGTAVLDDSRDFSPLHA
jgi:D-serine dehydratase